MAPWASRAPIVDGVEPSVGELWTPRPLGFPPEVLGAVAAALMLALAGAHDALGVLTDQVGKLCGS